MNKPKIMLLLTACILSLTFAGNRVYAETKFKSGNINAFKIKNYQKPDSNMQLGSIGAFLYTNYSIPTGDIGSVLNSSIGFEGGAVYRKFLFSDLDIQLASSINTYTTKFDNSWTYQAINIKLVGRYNFYMTDLPGCMYVEGGGGISFEKLVMSDLSADNTDPLYMLGIGYELPFIENIMAKICMGYMVVPQKTAPGGQKDGSYINFTLGANYEFLGDSNSKPVKLSKR